MVSEKVLIHTYGNMNKKNKEENKKIYRLVLENGKETMKWINSLKILHRLKQMEK